MNGTCQAQIQHARPRPVYCAAARRAELGSVPSAGPSSRAPVAGYCAPAQAECGEQRAACGDDERLEIQGMDVERHPDPCPSRAGNGGSDCRDPHGNEAAPCRMVCRYLAIAWQYRRDGFTRIIQAWGLSAGAEENRNAYTVSRCREGNDCTVSRCRGWMNCTGRRFNQGLFRAFPTPGDGDFLRITISCSESFPGGGVLVAILSAVGSFDEMGYSANATVRQSRRLGKSRATCSAGDSARRSRWSSPMRSALHAEAGRCADTCPTGACPRRRPGARAFTGPSQHLPPRVMRTALKCQFCDAQGGA